MNNSYPVSESIKIILLNDADELLLMLVDDPKTMSIGGEYKGPFWNLVGGRIEENETVLEAAEREVYEETGIGKKDIQFGPVVWFGEFVLILHGHPTHIYQRFIVARTKQKKLSLANLTQDEPKMLKNLSWFSLGRIINSREIIYPVLLPNYLPDVIAGKYPKEPFEINLAVETKR
jgi:8-oxo-dGTP pyrophosphatase MutT (NUDIX family)